MSVVSYPNNSSELKLIMFISIYSQIDVIVRVERNPMAPSTRAAGLRESEVNKRWRGEHIPPVASLSFPGQAAVGAASALRRAPRDGRSRACRVPPLPPLITPRPEGSHHPPPRRQRRNAHILQLNYVFRLCSIALECTNLVSAFVLQV